MKKDFLKHGYMQYTFLKSARWWFFMFRLTVDDGTWIVDILCHIDVKLISAAH